MEPMTLGGFLDWKPIGPGRKRVQSPRAETAIELRLMDDILEVVCPVSGCEVLYERARDFEHAHGSCAVKAALLELGVLDADEAERVEEAAGLFGPEPEPQRDLVAAARALGFFRKSLYLAHEEGTPDGLVPRPLRALVGDAELREAVRREREEGRPVGEVVRDLVLQAQKEALQKAWEEEAEPIDLDTAEIPEAVRALLNPSAASSLLAIPLKVENEMVVVAVLDPLDFTVIDALKGQLGCEVSTVQASEASLFRAIERFYGDDLEGADEDEPAAPDLEAELQMLEEEEAFPEAIPGEAEEEGPDGPAEEPGARTLEALLLQLIDERAEQLVLEPLDIYYRVRIRREGRLRDAARLPRPAGQAVVEHALGRARLDPAALDMPQGGRIDLALSGELFGFDIEMAPAAFGPTLVVRARPQRFRLMPLESLFLISGDALLVRATLDLGPGLTVIAAPERGGRTTLLYALLREADRAREHVLGLERYVRAPVDGATQIAWPSYGDLHPAIEGLRPDRVLIDDLPQGFGPAGADEVRLALELALSGARVAVAVAAPHPLAAIARLAATGVDAKLILSALRAVIGLRLVKRIDRQCQVEFEADPELARDLGLPDDPAARRLSVGLGGWECGGTGYLGRSALAEVIPLDQPALREAAATLDRERFERAAREAGHRLLREKALYALQAGLTTVSQVEDVIAQG